MTIEIKTDSVDPIRHTYSNIQRRFGDKPASRYQEASFDVEAKTNFHYRPLWDEQYALNDPTRTAITMADWYAITDPRQFYYSSYVNGRAKMQEAAESSFSFCDKRQSLAQLDEETQDILCRFLLPFRHTNLAANMNNSAIAGDAVATTVTQAHIFQAMDHLGIGQYLSRIGLLIDGNSATSLETAKQFWMDDPCWQPLRQLTEDTLVIKDWFELTLVQNLLLDKMLFPFCYQLLDDWLQNRDISLLTEFMRDWNKDTTRWITAVVKTAASESTANQQQLMRWVEHWQPRILKALTPLAEATVGVAKLGTLESDMQSLLKKSGLQPMEKAA